MGSPWGLEDLPEPTQAEISADSPPPSRLASLLDEAETALPASTDIPQMVVSEPMPETMHNMLISPAGWEDAETPAETSESLPPPPPQEDEMARHQTPPVIALLREAIHNIQMLAERLDSLSRPEPPPVVDLGPVERNILILGQKLEETAAGQMTAAHRARQATAKTHAEVEQVRSELATLHQWQREALTKLVQQQQRQARALEQLAALATRSPPAWRLAAAMVGTAILAAVLVVGALRVLP